MHVLVSQHLPDLPVTQRCFPLTHLSRDRYAGTLLLQELHRRHRGGDGVVRSIEDLETQSIVRDAQVADLAEISRIDVRPSIPFPGRGTIHVAGKVGLVLVRFDHVADAQRIDVRPKPAGEAAPASLAAQLRGGVRVHRVDVVVFLQRK